jgi:hypothetical protein
MVATQTPEPTTTDTAGKDESPSGESSSKGIASIINAATSFMTVAAKEWFTFLLYQPTDPPFQYSAKFANEFDRVVRLVVMVIILTSIVLGSASLSGSNLVPDKTALFSIVKWAIWVLIGAFLTSIVYHIFAFLTGVRRCLPKRPARHRATVKKRSHNKLVLIWELQKRRKLSIGQILFSLLYILIPWIPIYAFLQVALATSTEAGTFKLTLLVVLFWVCPCYIIFNFTKAIARITHCPRYRVLSSVLLPLVIILVYILF